jgi:hypothetical protein
MNEKCPECGGPVVDGECLTTVDGREFSCGWREDPILELVERPEP